jgi:hypothetical protein
MLRSLLLHESRFVGVLRAKLRFGGEEVVVTVAALKFYERYFAGSGKLGAVLVSVDLRPNVLL